MDSRQVVAVIAIIASIAAFGLYMSTSVFAQNTNDSSMAGGMTQGNATQENITEMNQDMATARIPKG